MQLLQNDLGQPIGFPVPDWTPRPVPPRTPMEGRFARVEILDPERHAAELYDANSQDAEGRIWTYLGYGPFADYAAWFGPDAVVLDPPDLREAVIARLKGVLA